jgi:hypothetical protein
MQQLLVSCPPCSLLLAEPYPLPRGVMLTRAKKKKLRFAPVSDRNHSTGLVGWVRLHPTLLATLIPFDTPLAGRPHSHDRTDKSSVVRETRAMLVGRGAHTILSVTTINKQKASASRPR